MAYFSAHNGDRMLQELNRHESRLNSWLDSSPSNVILFIEIPWLLCEQPTLESLKVFLESSRKP